MKRKLNPFSNPPKRKELLPHNKEVYEYLQAGNTINFVTARSQLGTTQLDKRIQEIRQFATVYSRSIRISNIACYEYSLKPFDNNQKQLT